jgi:hypothetical protein
MKNNDEDRMQPFACGLFIWKSNLFGRKTDDRFESALKMVSKIYC